MRGKNSLSYRQPALQLFGLAGLATVWPDLVKQAKEDKARQQRCIDAMRAAGGRYARQGSLAHPLADTSLPVLAVEPLAPAGCASQGAVR